MNTQLNRYNLGVDAQLSIIQSRNPLIFKTDTVTLIKDVGATTANYYIDHNLGYIPAHHVYFTNGNDYYSRVPYNTIIATEFDLNLLVDMTEMRLTIIINMASISGMVTVPTRTVTFKYFILREQAN